MSCDAEQSFLEDGIFLVPEGKGGTHVLMRVGDAANSVLALAR